MIITGLHENETIVLDDNEVLDAALVNCRIMIGGGKIVIIDSEINKCRFEAFGAAATVISFLKEMAKQDPDIIRQTFPELFSPTDASSVQAS